MTSLDASVRELPFLYPGFSLAHARPSRHSASDYHRSLPCSLPRDVRVASLGIGLVQSPLSDAGTNGRWDPRSDQSSSVTRRATSRLPRVIHSDSSATHGKESTHSLPFYSAVPLPSVTFREPLSRFLRFDPHPVVLDRRVSSRPLA